jgi:hypothetical protein
VVKNTRAAASLPYPEIACREAPQRAQQHVSDSIARLRWRIAAYIAQRLRGDVRSVRRVMVNDTVKDHPSNQAASNLSQLCLWPRALFARSVLPDRGSFSRNGLGEPQQGGNTLDRAVLPPPFPWGCPNKSPRLRLVGAWCTEALFPHKFRGGSRRGRRLPTCGLAGCGNTAPRSHPKGQFKRC